MQNTIQLTIPVTDEGLKDVLVARLSETGFDGFEEEQGTLKAFCNEGVFDNEAVKQLLDEYNLGQTQTIIPPQNWNGLWESSFQPVVVEGFAGVRASFHEPMQGVQHEIIITPKMSFGTGHHATTYMVIQQMQGIDFNGKAVFDFGTGTGILAILAKMLGAKTITAIDIDKWSITNAQENFDNNHITANLLLQADTPAVIDGKFDIILANINKNILLQYIPVLAGQLVPAGILLLSGLLAEDEDDILLKASQNSLKKVSIISRDKWICITLHA